MDFAHTPAQAPPPGVTPNFVSPANHAHILIIVSATCLTLLIPFVALRLYARVFITRSFGLDDGNGALSYSRAAHSANGCQLRAFLQW